MDILMDILNVLLDLIFPQQCLICGKLNSNFLCENCLSMVELVQGPICSICGKPRDKYFKADLCEDCAREKPPFALARSAAIYSGVMKDAIHHLKFNNRKSLSSPLGKIFAASVKTSNIPLDCVDIVIPVPLSRQRQRQRSFNQSELLARDLAKACELEFSFESLSKIKDTRPQFDLDRRERLVNEIGAYEARGVKNLTVLLIDDIYTTGSTAREASKALMIAGAKEVYVLTLARAIEKGI
jgi:ComF family protein